MRWMAMLTGVLLVAPVFGQGNDAEKLYRTMEKKIRSAKAIHVVFDGDVAGDGKKGNFNGSLDLADGNKMRLDVSGELGGNPMKVLAVSDGKTCYLAVDGKVKPQTHGPEEGDYAKALGLFARAGATALMHAAHSEKMEKKEPFDLEKMAAIKDIKAAGKEKIGSHEAQIVQYQLDFGKEGTAQVKLWIDTATDLPVKREMTVNENGKTFRAVERITAFEVNPTADPKAFQLPK